jgi:hypothetical protein
MTDKILESISNLLPTISFFDVLINISVAFLLGILIAAIYRYTYDGISYSSDFIHTLIIITMVTTVVIMVIGNNLARAFGLVGAMSIIRFRTALKESRDIAFVFFGLAAGMAAGAGNHLIGLIGIPLIGLFALILYWINYGVTDQQDFLLKFSMLPNDLDEPIYKSVFNQYLERYKRLSIRSARLGQYLELTFKIRFKNKDESEEFIQDLSALEGIERATLFLHDDGEFI